jgi:hypothetical protein
MIKENLKESIKDIYNENSKPLHFENNNDNKPHENSHLLLKIYFDEKTKRFSLPKNFQELRDVAMKSFSSNNLMDPFEIYYMDEERDLILIENQFDYENACLFIKHNNSNTLKVSIKSLCNDKYDPRLAVKYLENSLSLSKLSRRDEGSELMSMNYTCERCSRKFVEKNSQQKHSQICSSVFGSKREPFDSKKQRHNEESMTEQKDNDENINDVVYLHLEKLRLSINKWRKSCKRLQKNMNKGREFRDMYIDVESKECRNCKRHFAKTSIVKHSENCHRIMNKREPFDSRRQRMMCTEQETLLHKNEEMEKNKKHFLWKEDNTDNYKIRPRWKRLSDRFRVIMRISRLLYNSRF